MNNLNNIKKEAMLKIFPGISEDSPCFIKPAGLNMDRLGLYYNEVFIAMLSKDMEKEYKEYIEELKWEEHHKIWDKFQEKHNLDGIWCIDDTYPEQKYNLDYNNIQYDSYWTKKTYYSVVKGDTWGDAYIACDKIIKECNDNHPFIELLTKQDGYINLHTGS